MNNIETMKMALEALLEDRAWLESDAPKEAWDKNNQAITSLRQAIEQAQQAEPFGASEETQRFAIQVEKLLCEKLKRNWSPSGISIQTLVDELADRQTQQAEPVGQMCEETYGRGQVMWFKKPTDGSYVYTFPPPRQPLTDEQWQEIASLTGCLRIEKRGRDAIMRIFDKAAHGIKGEA